MEQASCPARACAGRGVGDRSREARGEAAIGEMCPCSIALQDHHHYNKFSKHLQIGTAITLVPCTARTETPRCRHSASSHTEFAPISPLSPHPLELLQLSEQAPTYIVTNVTKSEYLHHMKPLPSQVPETHYALGATSMACQH